MDKLPPEILCDIFLGNIPRNHEQEASVDPIHGTLGPPDTVLGPSVLVPLYASHVCRTWRHVSLSCGELWSYLRIGVDNESWKCETKRKRMLDIFDTWLSRTNGHPINYMFACHLPYDDSRDIGTLRDVLHVITTLVSQQHRWKDVSFAWMNIEMSSEFPYMVLTNMPMLTSFSLSLSVFRDYNLHLHATISIAKSSKLKRLRLEGPFKLDTGDVPIHSLTESSSLRPHSYNPDYVLDCLRFLRVAPNLTKFLFHSIFYETSHSDNTEPVKLPRLRALTATPFVVDKLTLPSLEALVLDGAVNGTGSVSGIYRNFFQRSLPPLIQLELCNEDADAFIPILPILPTLKRLKLSRTRISWLFFHELAVDVPAHGDGLAADSRVVCPSLVFLELYIMEGVWNDDGACADALISMVKSRAAVLGTFKTAEIKYPEPKKITNLVEDGGGWNFDDLRHTVLREVIIYGDVYPHPIKSD